MCTLHLPDTYVAILALKFVTSIIFRSQLGLMSDYFNINSLIKCTGYLTKLSDKK